MPTGRQRGFTLIELLIVVTILAIIASIALPNLMSARSNANEKALVATLRSLVTAQQLARTNAMIDMNNNGHGEAATFEELAGSMPLRGTVNYLRPAYLSASLGNPDADGHVLTRGFYIAMYLPDAVGDGLVATPANLASISPSQAENYWVAIAWPRDRSTQGHATYFVNGMGDIMQSQQASYSGKTSVPPPGCALLGVPATAINTSRVAANTIGADGNLWKVVH